MGPHAHQALEYLRFAGARDGVLWAASRLFGVRFERRAAGEVATWHEDVEVTRGLAHRTTTNWLLSGY